MKTRERKCTLDWISINGRLCPRNFSSASGSCSYCEWELRSNNWVEKCKFTLNSKNMLCHLLRNAFWAPEILTDSIKWCSTWSVDVYVLLTGDYWNECSFFWILPNNVQVFHGLSMDKKPRGAAKRCRHTYLTTEQMISPLRWYSLYPRYRDTGHKEWSCWLSWRVWWTSGWRSSTSPQIFPLWIAIQLPMWNIWISPLSYPHY